jgi:hypothetical protein
VKIARQYIILLNQHIDKENNVLFPLAEKNLSELEQIKLWEGFEQIETEKIGVGKADMYFFETLVRIHRAGEGASYTGLKPGAEIDPAIAMADEALESGSVFDTSLFFS